MANPFLVLGGIAISVATAAFGILQVPGWVASAQDAAAINDIAQASQAQAAAMTERGAYFSSMDELNAFGSVKVTSSQGSSTLVASNPSGTHSLAVARSDSGSFFARLSDRATIGKGPSIEAAVADAGTTVSDGITAEGVRLPLGWDSGWVTTRNFAPDPGKTGLSGFVVSPGAELELIEGPGRPTIRSTQVTEIPTLRWLEIKPREDTPFGKQIRFTATIHASERMSVDLSMRAVSYEPETIVAPDQTIVLQAGANNVDVIFATAGAVAATHSGLAVRSDGGRVGAWLEFTDISLTSPGVTIITP